MHTAADMRVGVNRQSHNVLNLCVGAFYLNRVLLKDDEANDCSLTDLRMGPDLHVVIRECREQQHDLIKTQGCVSEGPKVWFTAC